MILCCMHMVHCTANVPWEPAQPLDARTVMKRMTLDCAERNVVMKKLILDCAERKFGG